MRGRDHLENTGVERRIILDVILGKLGGKLRTGSIWFRIGTCGQLL